MTWLASASLRKSFKSGGFISAAGMLSLSDLQLGSAAVRPNSLRCPDALWRPADGHALPRPRLPERQTVLGVLTSCSDAAHLRASTSHGGAPDLALAWKSPSSLPSRTTVTLSRARPRITPLRLASQSERMCLPFPPCVLGVSSPPAPPLARPAPSESHNTDVPLSPAQGQGAARDAATDLVYDQLEGTRRSRLARSRASATTLGCFSLLGRRGLLRPLPLANLFPLSASRCPWRRKKIPTRKLLLLVNINIKIIFLRLVPLPLTKL